MNGAASAAVPEIAAWSADVFAQRAGTSTHPVLAPVLARSAITLLTGPRGVGKSWLALSMAHAAARGGALAGWRARKPCRTVYVDAASGEALLQGRLAALAPHQLPPSLVIVPGDAQAQGLPDVAGAAGREALDRLTTDADLVVLDGLASLVQTGRGVGARWSALADWLRSLRRRGTSVLLVETSEPRAIAALADTVLRLERPADMSANDGLRFTVRVAASRALAGESCRGFELHLALRADGAVWTRRDEFDHRALAAWRLHKRDYPTREIARRLGVSPATAWRLVERGKATPAHLRDRAELPELEAERRWQVARKRAEARRKAERLARREEEARHTHLPNGEKEGPAAQQREDEGEITSGDDGAKRAIARPLTLTLSPLGRGDAHDVTAHSPEAVKQSPASLDAVATDEMLAVFLARRCCYRSNQPPPPDRLAKFAYEELACTLRSRLSGRVLNRKIVEDDTRGTRPLNHAERLWRTPQHLLPYGGGAP